MRNKILEIARELENCEITEKEAENKFLFLFGVTNRYLFFYENDGNDGYNFTIYAKNNELAFDIAYKQYGSQVSDMICKRL